MTFEELMTAILGFNHLDGVLMLADSEEVTSYESKSECDKIERFICPIGTVITGGAGDSHLIACANQELLAFMRQMKPEHDVIAEITNFAASFWEEAIGPYRGFVKDYIPDFEMLIA